MRNDPKSRAEDAAPINDFNGHYQYLNNDHPAWVALDGVLYPSASIAYQAARTDNPEIRKALNQVETYEKFKQISLTIPNPSDWNNRKYRVMEKLLRDKFKRNKQFSAKLAETYPRNLVNTFKEGGENEEYWGVVKGRGNNALGKILMGIRDQIRKGMDSNYWISDQGIQINEKLRASVSIIVTKEEKPIDKLFLEKKSKFFFGSHSSNDFKLDHPSISKSHACIYFAPGITVMLVDLASSNGTFLIRDGQNIKLDPLQPIQLKRGDIVAFGNSSKRYKLQIDCTAAEQYLKAQKMKEQQLRRSRQERKVSRSRSRSPKHKKAKS